jgi:hypothetical protein
MKKAILGLALGIMCLGAFAEDPFNEQIPDRYTVVKGDTLWDISEYFLKSPWLWPEIWYANPQVANPHLIYPGDVIKLIYVDGKLRLTVERSRDIKLSPQIKVLPHANPIPALPLELINDFLNRNRVLAFGVLEAAPYVLAGEDERILSGKGNDFFARGDFSELYSGYSIYRKSGVYVDPATGEVLGVRAKDIGSGQLKSMDDDIAKFAASRSVKEIRPGDRVLPTEERIINSIFYPKAPASEVSGLIMDLEDGLTKVGSLDVVAINLGDRDGVESGTVLAIYKAGHQVHDIVAKEIVTLPSQRVGLLMVFRSFEKMSYALVLRADEPLSTLDIVKNP